MPKTIIFLFLLLFLIACDALQPIVKEDPNPIEEPIEEEIDLVNGKADFQYWIHSPLHPGNQRSVRFKTKAIEVSGIDKIELHVFEYQWYENTDGLPSKRKRTNGQWGLLETWEYNNFKDTVTIDHLYTKGFPKGSNVEYVFRIYNTQNGRTERMAQFDAGESLWPNNKILLYATSRQPLKSTINLCFLPDTDFRRDWRGFLSEVEDLIYKGYHSSNMIRDDKDRWTFFYTQEEVDGFALSQDFTNEALFPSFMKDSIIDGIDAFGLLHKNKYSDGAYLYGNIHFLAHSLFTSESYNWGTAIHETSHAVFNLSDEYDGCACFDSGEGTNMFTSLSECQKFNRAYGFDPKECSEIKNYLGESWYMSERDIYFDTEAECQAFNRAQGYDEEACETFIDLDGKYQYRAVQGLCIMQDDGDHIVRDFQRTCGTLIEEYYQKLDTRKGVYAMTEEQDNVYGYEEVVFLELDVDQENWNLKVDHVSYGIPDKNFIKSIPSRIQIGGSSSHSPRPYHIKSEHPGGVHFCGGHQKNRFHKKSKAKCKTVIPLDREVKGAMFYRSNHSNLRNGQQARGVQGPKVSIHKKLENAIKDFKNRRE